MKGLKAAIWAETLKVRRAKIFPITLGFFAFVATMMGLIVYAAGHPELMGRSTVLSAKASIVGNADWPAFLDLMIQIILALGALGTGVVTSWVFGREYADRTLKDLLALPMTRTTVVMAKFSIVTVWGGILCLVLLLTGMGVGWLVGIPGGSLLRAAAFRQYAEAGLLTVLLCAPTAYVAHLGRGYLLPIGYTILTLIITQLVFIGAPEIIQFVPWAYPALASQAIGPDAPAAGGLATAVYILFLLGGGFATAYGWKHADHQ